MYMGTCISEILLFRVLIMKPSSKYELLDYLIFQKEIRGKTVMSVLGRRLALVSRDLLGMSSVCACRGKISLVSALREAIV